MRYRELLKLYDKNALSEEEMEQVSREIEKQDAISEYLFEKDGAFPPGWNTKGDGKAAAGEGGKRTASGVPDNGASGAGVSLSEDALRFTRHVNRLIRRAFIKMGAVVGGVVLAILLFVLFILPQIVSLFYYDPAENVAENTSRLCLDLRVYTELTMPGYLRDDARVTDNGYGNYEIMILQNISYNQKMTNVAGTIKKGRLMLYDMNLLNRPSGNVFAWFQMAGGKGDSLRELTAGGARVYSVAGNRERATESLGELSDTETYLAYVTLDRMMPYEEFMEFVEKNEYPISWCAVCTRNGFDDGTNYFLAENLGFVCRPDRSCVLNWNREDYPNLILWAEGSHDSGEDFRENVKEESYMKEHFVSMLRYMAGQKKFLAMMEGTGDVDEGWYGQRYAQAADYVEKNGLTVYGCVAVTNKEMILQMNEDEAVYEIYAEELR